MPDNRLIVKMLGGFSLLYAGKELILDRSSVSKTTQLLQMVLLHQEDGIAKTSLIDGLYGREDVENRNGSLNNTLFRLRRQLKAAGLPESNYINIQKGMCRWDPGIPVEIDCCRFEEKVLAGQREERDGEKDGILPGGLRPLRRRVPAGYDRRGLVTVRNIHYRNLYFSCLEELCGWLKEKEEFEEIYQLTTQASAIYPLRNGRSGGSTA